MKLKLKKWKVRKWNKSLETEKFENETRAQKTPKSENESWPKKLKILKPIF